MFPPAILTMTTCGNSVHKLSELWWCWMWGHWTRNCARGHLNFIRWPRTRQRTLVQVALCSGWAHDAYSSYNSSKIMSVISLANQTRW